MIGITVVIIIVVPILFQVVYHNIQSKKRHEEIKGRLEDIEKELKMFNIRKK